MGYHDAAVDSTTIQHPVKASSIPVMQQGYLPTLFTNPPSPPVKADESAVDSPTICNPVEAGKPVIDAFSVTPNDTELEFSATQAHANESAPVAALNVVQCLVPTKPMAQARTQVANLGEK
ncbi:hypothetical protein LTR17_011492 [Elasticomyces elasticus]|nr:hypothetical protein LTR17_011492 [Elasticomyces elasticus]